MQNSQPMEDKTYIENLEDLLIFLCQTYEDIHETALKEARENNNDFAFKMPTIQGSPSFAVGLISKIADKPTLTASSTVLAEELKRRYESRKENKVFVPSDKQQEFDANFTGNE